MPRGGEQNFRLRNVRDGSSCSGSRRIAAGKEGCHCLGQYCSSWRINQGVAQRSSGTRVNGKLLGMCSAAVGVLPGGKGFVGGESGRRTRQGHAVASKTKGLLGMSATADGPTAALRPWRPRKITNGLSAKYR